MWFDEYTNEQLIAVDIQCVSTVFSYRLSPAIINLIYLNNMRVEIPIKHESGSYIHNPHQIDKEKLKYGVNFKKAIKIFKDLTKDKCIIFFNAPFAIKALKLEESELNYYDIQQFYRRGNEKVLFNLHSLCFHYYEDYRFLKRKDIVNAIYIARLFRKYRKILRNLNMSTAIAAQRDFNLNFAFIPFK